MADLDKMLTGFQVGKPHKKNEIFVHFHSNLGILTGFQKPCEPVWIRYCYSGIFGQNVYPGKRHILVYPNIASSPPGIPEDCQQFSRFSKFSLKCK